VKASGLIGLSGIGFGSLFLWSAYTKKPLFGTAGLVSEFFSTGSFVAAGDAVRTTTTAFGTTPSAPSATVPVVQVPGENVTPPGGTVYDV
jgi:hypothetical protein